MTPLLQAACRVLALVMTLSACTPPPADAPAATAPPVMPAALLGTWSIATMAPPNDSVVATGITTFGADGSMRIVYDGRADTVVAWLVSVSEDASGVELVRESGPYPSAVRPGTQVTTRTVTRFRGDTGTGTWTGIYSDGETRSGSLRAVRLR